MCHTSELVSTICLHKHRYTERCPKARSSKLAIFARPCHETLHVAYEYKICCDCRLFYQRRRIPEHAAISQYQNYKQQSGYYGALTPESQPNGEILLLRDVVAITPEVVPHARPLPVSSSSQSKRDSNERLLTYESELVEYLFGDRSC